MYNKLLLLALWSSALNILFTPINGTIAAMFGRCTILFMVLYPFIRLYGNHEKKINIYILFFLFLLLFSMITSIEYFEIQKLEQYVESVVMFLVFYWSLSFKKGHDFGLQLTSLFKVNYLLCAIFIVYSFGPFSFKYDVINQWGGTIFNMGLGNPNAVSVYVMFSLILLIIQLLYHKKLFPRLLIISLIGILIYILFMLKSRTVVICILVLIVVVFLKVKIIFHKWIPYMAMSLPLFMIGIQMALKQYDLGITFLGKELATGRADVYGPVLNAFREHPQNLLFGYFFKYSFENKHNSALIMIATIGVVGYIVFFKLWINMLNNIRRDCNGSVRTTAYIALLVFM